MSRADALPTESHIAKRIGGNPARLRRQCDSDTSVMSSLGYKDPRDLHSSVGPIQVYGSDPYAECSRGHVAMFPRTRGVTFTLCSEQYSLSL